MISLNPPKTKARVLIADDHVVVREGLALIVGLCPDFEVVAEAADGEEAVALALETQPDLLILDLRMPRLDGVEVVRRVLPRMPKLGVLILTTYDTDEDIYNCIKSGAKGYLLKDSRREVIIEAMRKIVSGEVYTPPEIAARLHSRLADNELSARELEVLRCMSAGLSNKEIGQKLFIGEGTVKCHARSINEKLHSSSRTEAVASGRKRGYLTD